MTGIALDYKLTQKSQPATAQQLAALWRTDTIELLLPSMAGFAAAPTLGNKLRGALGAVLLQSASPAMRTRKPCDWPHTSTMEILFGRRPLIKLGDYSSEIAKPYVFQMTGQKCGGLLVTLQLFGLACMRTPAIADALIVAIRERVRWHDLAKDGCAFLPSVIEPTSLSLVSDCPLRNEDPAPERAQLVFQTPLDADRGDPGAAPSLILERIIRRCALIAPWHGVTLGAAYAEFEEAARNVVITECSPTSAPSGKIGGHRMANTLSPPLSVTLSGPLDTIWPALLIGEAAHIGRGASLGLGRYRIFTY